VKRTLPLFIVANAASATLSGGQSPGRWRQECARRAAWRQALSRGARWSVEVCAVPAALNDVPPWGGLLAQLAAQPTARAEGVPARDRLPGARPFKHESRPRRQPPARRPASGRQLTPPLPHTFRQPAMNEHGGNSTLTDVSAAEFNDQRRTPSTRHTRLDGPSEQLDERRGAQAYAARADFAAPASVPSSEPGNIAASSADGGEVFEPDDAAAAPACAALPPDVAALSRVVGRELLRRLAGRDASPPLPNQTASGAVNASADEQPSARPTARTATPPWSQPPGREPGHTPLDGAAHVSRRRTHTADAPRERERRARQPAAFGQQRRAHQWVSLLAARAASALRRAGAHPFATERREESSSSQPPSLLRRQLASPVAGETSPPDLLRRLADFDADVSRETRRAHADNGAWKSPPRRASTGEASPVTPDAGRDAPAPVSPQPATLEIDVGQTRRVASGSDLTGADVSPAADAPPPLLPPPLVGMPVLPMALATAREGARAEALEAEEDLDALAAKIKFILDEQARRHGIDV
jgi:hypothetical protein